MKRFGTVFLISVMMPSLAACGVGANDGISDDALLGANGAIANNDSDPAMAGALEDQIVVDPQLSGSSKKNELRPTDESSRKPTPSNGTLGWSAPADRAQVVAEANRSVGGKMRKAPAPTRGEPMASAETLGAMARAEQTACGVKVDYNLAWAQKLPVEFPVFPRANVKEAAGVSAKCGLRVVSFSSSAPLETVINWYFTKATNAGYSADHQLRGTEHWLGGARERDGGVYVVMVYPRDDGGVEVDLVVRKGG